ncbi:MAG: N-formylglutamate amidohydrolase [Paracoccaceae bacterium]|nr:N-formylglutamate amidohydrolase [Paracoccaceae bacterium]
MPSEQQDITWVPFHVLGETRQSRWLVLCDHASNALPPWLPGGSLGINPEEMQRHIAYDIGAASVTLRLAERLRAPAVMSNFSRLVIDPNRGEDDPTLVRRLYDETIIRGNLRLDAAEVKRRLDECYRPYHKAVERMASLQPDTIIVSVHSFTPQLRHKSPRPWHVGLLFGEDDRLSLALADLLRDFDELVVGLNEPYPGYLAGDTIDRHATRKGRHSVLIEIRNDQISDEAGQALWAERFADLLPKALEMAETSEGP